jgi:hypothetical protein
MITPDGVYGELTAEAVGDFQRLMGITESGAVDFVTWNSLVSEARKVREIYALPEKISPFDMLMYSAIIDNDDEYDIVYIVQVMLRALHVYDYQNVVVNGKMDEATRTLQWVLPCRIYMPDLSVHVTWRDTQGTSHKAEWTFSIDPNAPIQTVNTIP